MLTKPVLVSGRDALRASKSTRVGVSLAEINRDRLGAYGVLMPSSSAECVRFAKIAAKYADRLGVKFMIHMDRVTAATSSVVAPFVLPQLPGASSMKELAQNCPFNDITRSGMPTGVIACGNGVNLAREVFGGSASYFDIGMLYPIADEVIVSFCASHEIVVVLDETGLIEEKLDSLGIAYTGSRELGHGYDAESLRLMLLCEEPDFTEIADEVPERTAEGE